MFGRRISAYVSGNAGTERICITVLHHFQSVCEIASDKTGPVILDHFFQCHGRIREYGDPGAVRIIPERIVATGLAARYFEHQDIITGRRKSLYGLGLKIGELVQFSCCEIRNKKEK